MVVRGRNKRYSVLMPPPDSILPHGAATRGQLRNRKYPWNRWFDGKTHRLKWGRDFDPEPPEFRRQVLRAAKRMGAQIRTRIEVDEDAPIAARKRILVIEPRPDTRPVDGGPGSPSN